MGLGHTAHSTPASQTAISVTGQPAARSSFPPATRERRRTAGLGRRTKAARSAGREARGRGWRVPRQEAAAAPAPEPAFLRSARSRRAASPPRSAPSLPDKVTRPANRSSLCRAWRAAAAAGRRRGRRWRPRGSLAPPSRKKCGRAAVLPALTPRRAAGLSGGFRCKPPGSSLQSHELLPKSTWIRRRLRPFVALLLLSPWPLLGPAQEPVLPAGEWPKGVWSPKMPRPGACPGRDRAPLRDRRQRFAGRGNGQRERGPPTLCQVGRGAPEWAPWRGNFPQLRPIVLAEARPGRKLAGRARECGGSAFLGNAEPRRVALTAPRGGREKKSSERLWGRLLCCSWCGFVALRR